MQAKQLVEGTKADYDTTAHEDEPKDLPVGISIQNLTKIYDEVNITSVCICVHKCIKRSCTYAFL